DGLTTHEVADDSDEPDAPSSQRRGSSSQRRGSSSQKRRKPLRNTIVESSDEEGVEEARFEVSTKVPRQLTEKQRKKFKQEMPEIRRPVTTAILTEGGVDGTSDNMVWMARTEIDVIQGKRSINMQMKDQNAIMQQVLHRAFEIGDRIIAFGSDDESVLSMDFAALHGIITPFEKDGMDGIALRAMIEAAEQLGYDGDGDIAQRLELGSTRNYIRPLVSHRLGLFRSAIKKAVTPTVEHTFRLGLGDEPADGIPSKAALLKETSYIYPWDAMGLAFNQSAPYESSIIKQAIRASFFVSAQYVKVGLLNGKSFVSSYTAAPSESEIPPTMLALCMTAVESIISDHQLKLAKASDFNATNAEIYRDHLVRLVGLRRQRPKRYHRIMHELFTAVTSGHTLQGVLQGTSNGAGVDWSHIPDE
ncbi:uncharacterized protein B0H18DRAFT_1132188, partial [Fomitopsis serialis]